MKTLNSFTPLITVAMPVYNAGKFLRTSVMSIINQTYPHWELIIIDDGSDDNSIQSLNDVDDARIKIIQDGLNKGLAQRLNEIIDMANGDFIARMDHDDISYPERFLLQLKLFFDNTSLDLVAGRAIRISENNKPLGYLPFFSKTSLAASKPWLSIYMPHPTWMARAAWFKKHRYANPAPYLCEDQELLLRSYESSQFSLTNQVILAYRVRDSVPVKKILKVSWSLFKVQSLFFYHKRSYLYLLLSFLSFVLRLFKGLFTFNFYLNNISDHDFKSFTRLMNANEKK